jgi:hypothetical protein
MRPFNNVRFQDNPQNGTKLGKDEADIEEALWTCARDFLTFLTNLAATEGIPVDDCLKHETTELLSFLAFDEAHGLVAEPKFGALQSLYHNLETVLSWIKGHNICSLFLSTSSKLSGFAPPASLHPSARAVSSGKLIAPFTELPFDVTAIGLVNKLEQAGSLTLAVATWFSTIVKFGWPL